MTGGSDKTGPLKPALEVQAGNMSVTSTDNTDP
jgi:hypothetical protein